MVSSIIESHHGAQGVEPLKRRPEEVEERVEKVPQEAHDEPLGEALRYTFMLTAFVRSGESWLCFLPRSSAPLYGTEIRRRRAALRRAGRWRSPPPIPRARRSGLGGRAREPQPAGLAPSLRVSHRALVPAVPGAAQRASRSGGELRGAGRLSRSCLRRSRRLRRGPAGRSRARRWRARQLRERPGQQQDDGGEDEDQPRPEEAGEKPDRSSSKGRSSGDLHAEILALFRGREPDIRCSSEPQATARSGAGSPFARRMPANSKARAAPAQSAPTQPRAEMEP
jgi:hypothetical protein